MFTDQVCCRLWQNFKTHVTQNVGTDEAKSLDDPSCHIPVYICTWIYLECDIPDPQNNLRTRCANKTFSQALKMRAAISFHYNELGRGTDRWHQGKDGSCMGNPSLSRDVSHYMMSLQRRKVLPLHLNWCFQSRWEWDRDSCLVDIELIFVKGTGWLYFTECQVHHFQGSRTPLCQKLWLSYLQIGWSTDRC